MISTIEPVAGPAGGDPGSSTLFFRAEDVTGTHNVNANVQRTAPAGSVASAIARQLALPESVAWTLRSETTGAYLDDNRPIGDQLEPGARTTLTAKTHLGGNTPTNRR